MASSRKEHVAQLYRHQMRNAHLSPFYRSKAKDKKAERRNREQVVYQLYLSQLNPIEYWRLIEHQIRGLFTHVRRHMPVGYKNAYSTCQLVFEVIWAGWRHQAKPELMKRPGWLLQVIQTQFKADAKPYALTVEQIVKAGTDLGYQEMLVLWESWCQRCEVKSEVI